MNIEINLLFKESVCNVEMYEKVTGKHEKLFVAAVDEKVRHDRKQIPP